VEDIKNVLAEIKKVEAQALTILDEAAKTVREIENKADQEIATLRAKAKHIDAVAPKRQDTKQDVKIKVEKKNQEKATDFVVKEFNKLWL